MISENESRVFERLDSDCVVAVLVIDRVQDAGPVAEALLSGGVTAMARKMPSQ